MSLRSRIAAPDEGGTGREDGHLVAVYRAKLLEEIDLAEMSALTAADRRARLERVLGHIISREGPVLSSAERSQLIRRVVDEALGLGVLEPLLADASVTEIMVNGPDSIFVEQAKPRRTAPPALRLHRPAHADDRTHRLDGQPPRRRVEPDGRRPPPHRRARQRDHPPLALTGPTLTIRRFPARTPSRS